MANRPGKYQTALAALLTGLLPLTLGADSGLGDQPDFQAEFERICGQTDQASALSAGQLLELIGSGDALLERLEQASEPGAKVMRFRLARCRDFYQFMLEYLQTESRIEQGADPDA